MQTMISETSNGVNKTSRYGWTTKDEPGELKNIHKNSLKIHPDYQRDAIPSKIKEITSNWSWIAAGAVIVGERNGELWVIDGQHRVLAAKRRSDISHLPCLVFKTNSIKQEAIGFLDLNTGRKPVSSIAKFKAMIAAGDEAACIVQKTLDSLGVTPKATANKAKEIKSIAWAVKRAGENPQKFELVMRIATELSHDVPLQERLLDGLWYINERIDGGIEQKRIYDRLKAVGARRLLDAASKAAAYYVRGGAAVWAAGMIEELNRGLQKRFVLIDNSTI